MAFFYLTNSKTLEIFVFDNIISPFFFFFMRFSVSVGKKLKNTENRRFWLSCFVFLYRVLSMLFSVLVPSTPINIQKALFWKSRFFSSFRVQKHVLVVFSKTPKCMESKLYWRNKQKRVF